MAMAWRVAAGFPHSYQGGARNSFEGSRHRLMSLQLVRASEAPS